MEYSSTDIFYYMDAEGAAEDGWKACSYRTFSVMGVTTAETIISKMTAGK